MAAATVIISPAAALSLTYYKLNFLGFSAANFFINSTSFSTPSVGIAL
jgi:hypothetical protein